MPVGYFKELLKEMPSNVPLLGLDIGSRTIGVAVSDSTGMLATPLCTVKRVKFTKDITEIAKIAKEYDVGGFVLGIPLSMDGSFGKKCDMIWSFADQMSKMSELFGDNPWISMWDERLSTSAVKELLTGNIKFRKAKEGGVTDKLAAQIILQGALDFAAGRNA